jgi:uncharacterized protein YciI
MRVALICIDNPNMLQTRLDNRAAHLAHIETSGIVEMAGPFLQDGAMVGSLVVLNVESMEQAQDWAAHDPYAKAGLFAQVDMREWKKVVG